MISIYITCKDNKEAEEISKHLLKRRLIACANLFPIKSFYWWKGKINEDNEIAIIAKTDMTNFEEIKQEVKKLHSYEVPCIVSWKIEQGNEDYLDWIKDELEK
jgi:periplasmic divalent cation tolerance protein